MHEKYFVHISSQKRHINKCSIFVQAIIKNTASLLALLANVFGPRGQRNKIHSMNFYKFHYFSRRGNILRHFRVHPNAADLLKTLDQTTHIENQVFISKIFSHP
jgi:hypothetical protein